MKQISDIKELADHFRGLSDGSIQPFEPGFGICEHISILVNDGIVTEEFLAEFDEYIHIEQYYSGWDKFSGDICYPVPATDELFSAEGFYNYKDNLWEGTYGDLRKDLCLHIAKQLDILIEVN